MLIDALARKLSRLETSDDADTPGAQAAVAAILRPSADGRDAELLFIRRAERASDPWSGHIAFPGGRREQEDAGLLATAIRETMEEVAIDLNRATRVARLPDVPAFTRSKRGALTVAAWVFVIERDVVAVPNEEVAEILWIPFGRLLRGEGRGTFLWTWDQKTIELPCFRFGPAAHVLWGLTLRLVETMLDALGPEDDTPGPSSSA